LQWHREELVQEELVQEEVEQEVELEEVELLVRAEELGDTTDPEVVLVIRVRQDSQRGKERGR